MLVHQNHAGGGENCSIMVGMFVSLCLASKKPSEQATRTNLGVKLLSCKISINIFTNKGSGRNKNSHPVAFLQLE